MPNLTLYCHRCQIVLALLLLQLNFNVRGMWVHHIDIFNLKRENIQHRILRCNTSYREAISTEEQLVITLL